VPGGGESSLDLRRLTLPFRGTRGTCRGTKSCGGPAQSAGGPRAVPA
jgi:hypothetical protein